MAKDTDASGRAGGWEYVPHKKFGKFRNFFSNEKLYRTLKVNRFRDEATVFNYTDNQHEYMSWSFIQRNCEPALTRKQFGALVNRKYRSLRYYASRGIIQPPQYSYRIGGERPDIRPYADDGPKRQFAGSGNRFGQWYYHSTDAYALIEFFEQNPAQGRNPYPTREEIRQMLDYGIVIKAVLPDGTEVRLWDAEKL